MRLRTILSALTAMAALSVAFDGPWRIAVLCIGPYVVLGAVCLIDQVAKRNGRRSHLAPSGSAPVTRQLLDDLQVRIHRRFIDELDLSVAATDSPELTRDIVHQLVGKLVDQEPVSLSSEQRTGLILAVLDETFGLGPLEPLLNDPDVSDILIDGPHNVAVRKGGRSRPAEVRFRDESHLRNVLDRIVSMGKVFDPRSPVVSVNMANVWQVHAVIPPQTMYPPWVSITRQPH